MLHGLLTGLFVLLCFVLIFLILLQKGKGGTGLFGSMTSTSIKIFGGSGGQDIFQRATWIGGACFMALALALAITRSSGTSLGSFASSSELPSQDAIIPVLPQDNA